MADDALTVVKGTLEDNVADKQVEFVGEIEGEEYQFAVQYDVLEALSGDVPEDDALELFERYSDDILEAALTDSKSFLEVLGSEELGSKIEIKIDNFHFNYDFKME